MIKRGVFLVVSDEHPDRDVHDNASRLLVELLKVSRDAAYASQDVPASERCDDPLLAVIESPSTVSLILDTMFKVNNQHRQGSNSAKTTIAL